MPGGFVDRELAVAEVRQVHQKATVAAGYIGETSCDDLFAEPSGWGGFLRW